MSHIVRIHTQLRDATAISAACHRLSLPQPTSGTVTLFTAEATGTIVQLPGWQFPLVIDTESGDVQFDNFNGTWGKQEYLDRFLQSYAVEKTKLEARKKGNTVSEQVLTDGSIKLTIQVA